MMSSRLAQLVSRKRAGHELSSREMEVLCQTLRKARGPDTMLGAFLVSCDVAGLNANEIQRWCRHLVEGEDEGVMNWPREEEEAGARQEEEPNAMLSVISVGGICDAATLVMIPAVAACGVKVVSLDKNRCDRLSNPLGRLECIVGFESTQDQKQIHKLVKKVGCCVARCPRGLVPTEGAVHNYMRDTGTAQNADLVAVCLLAEAYAHNCGTVLFNIRYGEGSVVRTKEEADRLSRNLRAVSPGFGFKSVVNVSRQGSFVRHSLGGVPEVCEVLQGLCGQGQEDLVSRASRLGGQALAAIWPGVAEDAGCAQVRAALTDGRGRQKLAAMLHAQGVSRSDVRALFRHRAEEISPVLPLAMYRTHLSIPATGYIASIDMESVAHVLSSLQREARAVRGETNHALGLELLRAPGASVSKGGQWGRLHHDTRPTPAQLSQLCAAIVIKDEDTTISKTADFITNGTKESSTFTIDVQIENQIASFDKLTNHKVAQQKDLNTVENEQDHNTQATPSVSSEEDIDARMSSVQLNGEPCEQPLEQSNDCPSRHVTFEL